MEPVLNTTWYRVLNGTNTQAGEMLLYGTIGPNEAIDDRQFIQDFAALAGKHKAVTLRLNSGGGSVFAGIPIYNAIAYSTAAVTIIVEGMAASMASILLQAAGTGRRKMYKNARVMVHKPAGGTFGSAKKMRDMAALLEGLEQTLADIYVERTGQPAATIQTWLQEGEDHWFTAQEALAAGLVDEIIDAPAARTGAPLNFAPENPKVAAMLNLAVEQGRIPAEVRSSFRQLLTDEYPAAMGFLAQIPTMPTAASTDPRAAWDFNQWRKEAPKALAELQNSNPTRYEALKELQLAAIRNKYRWM